MHFESSDLNEKEIPKKIETETFLNDQKMFAAHAH